MRRVALAFCLISLAGAALAEPPPPPNAPPSGAQSIKAEWYVSPAGVSVGPETIAQLIEMARAKTIARETPVWKDGWPAWKILGEVAELAPVVAAMPVSDGPPPAPAASQSLLDEKNRTVMLGEWKFEGDIGQGGISGYAKTELLFRTDGTYAGTQSVQYAMPGPPSPPFVSSITGRWSVTSVDEKTFALKLVVQGGGPIEFKMRLLDANTIQNSDTLISWHREAQ